MLPPIRNKMFKGQVLNTKSLEIALLKKEDFGTRKIAGHSCYFFYDIVNELDMFIFSLEINKNAQ